MRANQLIFLNVPLMFCLISLGACEKKAETTERGASVSGLQAMPDSFAVNGSLNIPTEAAGVADAAGKTVQLLSDSGQVVAEAVTASSGSFQIQVGGEAGLKLQEESKAAKSAVAMPQLMRLRSLFLTNGAQLTGEKDALGLLKPLIIDPQNMKSASGTYSVDTGSHDAEKVGAIYGKISLETGADPTGIDVYIPGTTYIAKTDGEGQFLLGFLPAGTYEVRADKDGYNSIEWPKVAVKKQETTPLPDAVMSISVGPKIETFELDSLSQADGIASLRLRIKSATKYRISALADFSDTQFNPLDAAIPEFTIKFPLAVGVQFVKIYLEAADSGGLSANATLTIDREAPSKGSVTAVTTNGYINSLDVPLLISAEGATRMKIGESQTALDAATWIAFAASHTHTLASATNGTRKLMVAFADDAGNTYGLGGEIQASFILDTISPADGVISLLPPESPTGAFNTPLAWLADYGEPMSYAIEVSSSAAFASILRTMESTQANTVINPPLETEGTYYWRVRAIDAAGNQSSWVPSGAKNSFKVVIMAQSYQAQFNVNGTPGSDTMFGKSILSVGDLNNDGVSEIAISVPGSGDGGCTDCGAVKIFNPASRSYMTTFASGLPNTAAFGHKMITCDVNGDGNKELIVSAPAKKVVKDGVTYNNVGGIYAYNLQNKSLLASFEPALPAVDGSGLMPGYMWCSSWNYSGSCPEYGWSYWPEATPSVPWGDGIYFGWDLTCLENNSGPSQLAVGSPNYSSSNNYAAGYREGRVDILGYAGGVFSKQSSLTNGNQAEESFGAAVVYLNQFKITADTNCDSVGETLAIGAPRRYISGQEMGAVDLYQKIGGTWTKCSTSFFSDPAKSEPSWSYFGSRLFNLGNFDKDGEGIQELAIATTAWSGGLIKFYNGGAAEVKSFYTNSSNLSRFGYQIKPAGDFNSDNQAELAIGVPGAYVNGKWSSGQVSIYQWSDLDLDDDADDSGMTPVTPLLQIQGKPEDGSALGADFIPILQSASIHSAFSSIFASRPSLSIGGMWSVGSIGNYAKIKMAPTSPYRVVGTNSGARFGTSMTAPGKDFDNDNVSDFIIGQPGGRCDGRPYGAVSLYSVLDKQVTYSICASPTDTWSSNYIESVGRQVSFLPNNNRLIFTNRNSAFTLNDDYLFDFRDTSQILQTPNIWDDADRSYFWGDFVFSEPWTKDWNDIIMVGAKSDWNSLANASTGYVGVYNYALDAQCRVFGEAEGDQFGFHSAFMSSIPDPTDAIPGTVDIYPELMVGAPGKTVGSGKGSVYFIKYDSFNCMNDQYVYLNATGGPTYQGTTFLRIDADHPDIVAALGGAANEGFGKFVMPLPDLDGSGDGVAFAYIANTNSIVATSTVAPQYFIFKISYDTVSNTYATSLVKYETGESGSMLGGYAKIIDDINGDGIGEVAISHPGGIGRLGKTGQVRILSGAGIVTADEGDDLLQMLYNPDPNLSNFGISFEYGDITGDGLKDFVIGADRYDTSAYQDAGAIYVFPVEPIQN